jgi:hypothetical protein
MSEFRKIPGFPSYIISSESATYCDNPSYPAVNIYDNHHSYWQLCPDGHPTASTKETPSTTYTGSSRLPRTIA